MFSLYQKIYCEFIKDVVRLYKVMPDRFRVRLWLIFLLQFLYALFETSTIFVIALFALSFGSPDVVRNNFVIRMLFDEFPWMAENCAMPSFFILLTCALTAIFIAVKNVMAWVVAKKSASFSEDVSCYIGEETLYRYLHKSYLWHISSQGTDIIQRMNFRTSLSELLVFFLMLYSNVICSLMLFLGLFIAEPFLTLLVIFIFSLVGFTTYLSMRKKIDYSGNRVAETASRESAGMIGVTQGIREVIIYRKQDDFLSSIVKAMREAAPFRSFLNFSGQVPAWLLETAGFSTIFGATCAMVLNGRSIADIVTALSMLMLTAWRVLPAVSRVMNYAVIIRGIRPRALLCLELLETFIKDKPEQLPEPDPDFRFDYSVTLEDVAFRYPGAAADNLQHITFTFQKGQRIGLIGSSGAGKSTLALLLCGLLPQKDGRFLVDGAELTPAKRAAYIQTIGFVPQNPMLMAGSVADNVAFSQWGKDYDLQEVETACRLAAADFVFEHPAGIHFMLGQGGSGLSGGQAQRISIARAFFTKPNIIIFDEATSALDQKNENLIKDTIEHLPNDVTSVIIAHRLTTIENCDVLVWLEKGQIRAIGSPDEVLPHYHAELT